MAKDAPPPLPPGSDQIAAWARRHRIPYEPHPNVAWFQAWEPFDTMLGAETWFNSVAFQIRRATFTLAEPWLAPPDSEPLDRTVLLFASHPGFVGRAAARGGEHFNSRVAFIEHRPPPAVQLGDSAWDDYVLTFAPSAQQAAQAFPPAARQLLARWHFRGHVEVRPGGLVAHFAGMHPTPADYERLYAGSSQLLGAFLQR